MTLTIGDEDMTDEKNNRMITREFLISDVQKLIKESKQTPILYTYQFKNHVLKEFTSWDELLKIVKLRMKKANKQEVFEQEYTNNELIKKVQKLAKELNKVPERKEFEYQFEAIRSFGTWNNFLKKADLKATRQYVPNEAISNVFLIKDIQKKANELGKTPALREYEYNSYVIRRFGTWGAFLKEAGLNNVKQGRPKKNVPVDFLIKDVQKQAKALGRTPLLREYEYRSYAIRHFGTWRTFLKKADLIIDSQGALLTEKH